MKKHLIVPLFLLLLTLTLTLILNQAPTAHAALSTVYLSSSGSDSGDGTEEAPYLTMEKALDAVSDGGVIQILDRITLTTSFKWKSHGKAVTITGGVLDLTAFGQSKPSTPLHIQDDVTFTDVELTFATIDWTQADDRNSSGKNTTNYMRTIICANGHHLVIASDVRFTYTYNTNVWLLGGAYSGKTVNGDTNLEVYAGTYTAIFGGGLKDTVKGDTHVTVGGAVNANAVLSNHSYNYCIFGGGWNGTVEGNTYLTITGNAKANYADGGAYEDDKEDNGKVYGYSNVTLEDGELMHLGGGSCKVNQEGLGANVTVTGGTVQQIFGGSTGSDFGSASKPVTVNVRILGGTVTRRIYGGCYNEYSILSGYSTAYHVWGNIILTLDANANIPLNSSDADKVIFARSRYSNAQTGEHSTILFAGSAAYTKFKGKLNSSVSSASAADEQHICTYTPNGGTVTEACSFTGCNHTATAAITLDPTVSRVYNGQAIEPANIEYSSGWKGEKTFDLTYSGNIDAGTATASMSNYLASASLNFSIEKAPSLYNAPVLDKIDESYSGKADGKITGLTAAMEYSTDGTAYTAVTDPDRDFPAGTYYVRYCADANHNPSATTELTIGTKKHAHTCEKCGAADWTAWTDASALPSTSGHYYLTTDVALPKTTTIGSSLDITLCLYGHNINLSNGIISLTGKLTVCDCTAVGEGDTYTAGSLYGGRRQNNSGGAIYAQSSGELCLYDGIIKDCTASNNSGAVYLTGSAKFNMYGGKICENTSGNAGGAVFLNAGTTEFHMTGGTISDNQAKNGGAIGVLDATAALENGAICGNTALSTGGNGGAIYATGSSTVHLTGMTVTGNTGTASSAIGLLTTAQCTVTDSVITGNTGSPAVRMNAATSRLTLTGRTQIQKNAAGNVYLIKGHPGVDVSGLSTGAKVGVTLADDRFTAEQMYITADMAEGVDPSGYVVSDDEKYEVRLEGRQLVLGDAIHTHCVCGKEGCTQHEMITFTPWEDGNTLPNTSGHYYLTTDVELSENATIDTALDITLCLHGHDINLSQNNISLSGKLTLCDCTAAGEGDTYTAGSLYGGTGSTGGAINSTSGSELYLYDGIIKDCTATSNGGAVCLGSNSKFFMHGGKICGSTSGNAGGAVFLSGAATAFHMTGGTISGNQAKNGGAIGAFNTTATLENGTICGNTALSTGGSSGNGGAIYMSGSSKAQLTGMTVTGNTGTMSSAIGLLSTAQCTVTDSVITGNTGSPAVRMNTTTSKLTLAGTTKIRNNTGGNVYLIKDHPGVDVSGLSAGAKVGVTLADDRISAEQIHITAEMAEGVDPSGYVVSDDKSYGVKLEGRQLVLGEPTHTHCVCGDEDCTEHTRVEYQAWDKTNSLPTSGNYYLTADVTLTDQTILSKNSSLNLCLNGHTVTGSSAKRILAMPNSGSTVTLSDCTATTVDGIYTAGKLTGAYHNGTGGGGVFFIAKGSTLNLYGGMITDNGCHNNGGAVYIQGAMNMYGGQISDNKAYETKKGVTTWKNGGNVYVCSEGSFTMYGGTIFRTVSGVAADKGGAIYVEADAAVAINGGRIFGNTAFSGGHDIYRCFGSTLTIDKAATGQYRYGTDLSGIVSVADIREGSLVSDGDFNTIEWVDANTIRITRKDTCLIGDRPYATLQAAADAAAAGEVITLNTHLNENIAVHGDVILNLNNKTLTGDITLENGAKLSGMDSATDRYGESEHGKICGTITDGGVKKTFQNKNSKKRYVAVHDEDSGTWTFNRFYIGMQSITADVNTGDVGYKAIVGGNEKVKNSLADKAFGFKVWVNPENPLAPTLSKNNFVTGDTGTTIKLRIANQLKYINDLYIGNKKDDATELQNKDVIAQVTIYFADDTYEVSSEYKYSIVQMYQTLDTKFDDFTDAQKASMANLLEKFPVMKTWDLPNTIAFASSNADEGNA